VLPVEITHKAPRIAAYDEATSTEALQDDVDALDEASDVALARATQYQQKFVKLPQQSSSFTISRGRRSSSMTQARWPWKTRVPMGETLHHDKSDTRRSLSTTR
jgi:hypothetical protein